MARTPAKGDSTNGAAPATTTTTTTAPLPLSKMSPDVNRIPSPLMARHNLQNGTANGVENHAPFPSTPTKKPSSARKTKTNSAGGSGKRIVHDNPDDFSIGDVPRPGAADNDDGGVMAKNGNGLIWPVRAGVEDVPMTDAHEAAAATTTTAPPTYVVPQGHLQVPTAAAPAAAASAADPNASVTPRKRGRPRTRFDDNATSISTTPKRQRATTASVVTPVKATPTKSAAGAATPSRATPGGTGRGRGRPRITETPTTRRTLADRSARKKTTRALIDRMVAEDNDDEDDETLGAAILGVDDDEDDTEDEDGETLHSRRGFSRAVAKAKASGHGGGLASIPEAAAPAEHAEQAEQVQQEPVAPAPLPRKRGRPPKNAPKPTAAVKAAPAPAPVVDPNAPPKRRPGRPRKTDTTAPGASSAAALAARELEAPRGQPAHEHFFFHNRSGAAAKTSNNTLAALRPLTYDEYFRLRDGGPDSDVRGCSRHEPQIAYLEDLHAQSFPQWAFELSQGFSVCLYGYGSKMHVLRAFARALHRGIDDHQAHKIVIANASPASASVAEAAAAAAAATTGGGGAAGGGGGGGGGGVPAMASSAAAASTLRDILLVVAAAATSGLRGSKNKDKDGGAPKLPTGAAAAEKTLLAMLDQAATTTAVTLIINGIDSPSLRRPAAQATLARLAAHPSIQLLCAADTPGFALLWDGAARSQYNFVFHDATTFRPLAGLDTVDEVHALLGRRVRRVGGKDGAAFVLRSLPENARNLFQLLVGEVLAAADEGGGGGGGGGGRYGDDGDGDDDYDHDGGGGGGGGDDDAESVALEYRMLYNKAVEEFICSSEMSFRTLLKEFHDHQMVTSRKDAFGTEMLSLPFRRDELEALLEDIAS